LEQLANGRADALIRLSNAQILYYRCCYSQRRALQVGSSGKRGYFYKKQIEMVEYGKFVRRAIDSEQVIYLVQMYDLNKPVDSVLQVIFFARKCKLVLTRRAFF